jgi:transcriptional regulator with XRE-family HTH domain
MDLNDLTRISKVRRLCRTGEARRRRLAAELTLREVAAACGTNQTTIWRWESGTAGLSSRTTEAALAYGALLDRLGRIPSRSAS